jgi:hypothetical protein
VHSVTVFENGATLKVTTYRSSIAPATYPNRDYTLIGGLMSYGANITDAWREVGSYTGWVLKGGETR